MVGRTRRVVSTFTLIAAAYVLVVPFGLQLFSRTRDAERLSEYYRPLMSDEGLDEQRANLAIVNDAAAELDESFLPEIQSQLGMTEAEFDAFVAQNYPNVAAFFERAPVVIEYVNPGLEAVFAQQDSFQDADDFPAANLPVTLGPWSLLALGLALAALGIWIRLGSSVLPVVAVTVAGVGLLFGPLVLGWFHQTEAAEDVAEVARAPFTTELADTTVNDVFLFDAAVTEAQEAMLPAIGQRLGMSPEETDIYLRDAFPATMAFLDNWPEGAYPGSRELTLSQIRFMDEFRNADATPYRALPWFFMAPGLLLLAAGGYGLLAGRRAAGAE